MKGPLKLEMKLPTDPTKTLPLTVLIDVKREKLTREDIKNLSQEIRRHGAHLVLIVTDRDPYPEALEDILSLPQVIFILTEHRDLVRLLLISQAKSKGVEIDSDLLLRAYESIFEKFDLGSRITEWVKRMTENGYLITYEGFIERTAQACRFFINTIGASLKLQESWEKGWKLRNLLPFGIKSEIIPDMGLEDLRKNVEILKDYGFLKEEAGKLIIQQHPSESRIRELLEYYGGTTTKPTLAKHFIFREAASRVFDSLLDHMKRKFLLSEEYGNIHLLKLSEVKEIRENIVERFERKKNTLRQFGISFTNILTWKKRGWQLISLFEIEKTVEELLKEIAITENQDIIRSHTFILGELVEWYEHYVDKIISSYKKSKEIVENLAIEVSDIQRRFREVLNNLRNSLKLNGLQVELQELNEIVTELEEVRNFLASEESREDLEKMIRVLAGDKESEDINRKEKLWTDIDEEMAKEGVKGEWTVAKYVLIKKRIEEIKTKAEELNSTLDSLNDLTQKLVNITYDFLKLFEGVI